MRPPIIPQGAPVAMRAGALDGARFVPGARDPAPVRYVGRASIIAVHGLITHRPMTALLYGSVSAVEIAERISSAETSRAVDRIVLEFDSFGGAVDGVPELAGKIHNAGKPISGLINTEASGTAYWLASQCGDLTIVPSGEAGGIGISIFHDDRSDEMAQRGIRRMLIASPRRKVEGNPWEPLDPDARAHLQRRVDAIYDRFVEDVAAGRAVSDGAVRRGFGQGRVVGAGDAVRLGLVDRVGGLGDVLAGPIPQAQRQRARRRAALLYLARP